MNAEKTILNSLMLSEFSQNFCLKRLGNAIFSKVSIECQSLKNYKIPMHKFIFDFCKPITLISSHYKMRENLKLEIRLEPRQ